MELSPQRLEMLKAHQDGWRHRGTQLGYPLCCIEWFIERGTKMLMLNTIDDMIKAAEVAKNQQGFIHGFIPCPECAKKVVPGTEESLIKDRICSTPYPDDSGLNI